MMKTRTKRILTVTAAICVLLCGAVAFTAYRLLYCKYTAQPVRIFIPYDATIQMVKDTLTSRLDGFGEDVYRVWRLQRAVASRAHGSYVVEPGQTALDVSRALRSGRQTPVTLSFNNVRTINDLAARLAPKMEWQAEDFLDACDSILPPKGFKKTQYSAAFLPDSYQFYWTDSAGKVVKRLSDFRDSFWTDERRAQAAALGLKPVEVATLASIVEEETSKADERGKVARLYLNRLNKKMMLQADPTVKFAVGDFGLRRILNKHLEVDSPYNTYKYQGLPPGPIRIVSQRTLEAVLDSPKHDYIYMCAKDDFSGYHNFASDYATHQANARRYRSELNRRGIK